MSDTHSTDARTIARSDLNPGLSAANEARLQRAQSRNILHGFGRGMSDRGRGLSAVRRDSHHAGPGDLKRWKSNVFPRIEKETRLEEIFAWADDHKEKGRPWGLLTPKQKVILREMHDRRCFTTGRLDWAWKQIAEFARCSLDTLSKALTRFEDLGLVKRWRRTIPVPNPAPGEPTTLQISNGYELGLPEKVAAIVASKLKKVAQVFLPPVPAPREPSEQEQAALGAQLAAKPTGDPAVDARRAHYLEASIQRMNARRNAGTFSADRDSAS
ncbi:hypothetical protein LK533_06195 [Sphingomonas sp. PL-96]|uniref:hypothetical protein n=1 Tax=Sphingomonas sp. PL-96 TaxID=2887201 RepID=UPI001E395989|nr:hypothetical protein [Sphingomonas sp. PL-96]MCC2976264.1 hypothetical protein [Sphingomonas sp. PL-96]